MKKPLLQIDLAWTQITDGFDRYGLDCTRQPPKHLRHVRQKLQSKYGADLFTVLDGLVSFLTGMHGFVFWVG
jgi:hypothetical protein